MEENTTVANFLRVRRHGNRRSIHIMKSLEWIEAKGPGKME